MTDITQTLVDYLYVRDHEMPAHRDAMEDLVAEHADEVRIMGKAATSPSLRKETHKRLSAMEAKIEEQRIMILNLEYAQSGRIDAMVQYRKEATP